GTLSVAASVAVDGGSVAFGSALAVGAVQSVAGSSAELTIENSGAISVAAKVDAVASSASGLAIASARAFGLRQAASGAEVAESLTNSGSLDVAALAHASAPGGGDALAFALAIGARQTNVGAATATEGFTNSGAIHVQAVASAEAGGGSATAAAAADQSFAGGLAPLTVAIANSGAITAIASAVAPGKAYALARGIYVNNAPSPSFEGSPVGG